MIKIILLSVAFVLLFGCSHKPSAPSSHHAFDAELTNYDYPYPVKYFDFESQKQKLKMAYLDISPSSNPSGKTVVLFHGKNFNASYWRQTIEALAENGFRVIVPDQIGFGKSSKPQCYQFTFQALAQNTKALLDNLAISDVAIVGHSMGGMLATRFALMHPERTKKLVLVNPIGLEDWKTMVPYRSVDQWYAQELNSTIDGIREYQKTNYYDGHWKPEYEGQIEFLKGWLQSSDYPRIAWNAALTYDMIMTQPVLYEFPLVKTNTLLIIGQRDRTALGKAWAPESVRKKMGNYPALARKAARAIPNAKLVELNGVGHLPHIEAFDSYIGPLLAFLKNG